MTDYATKASNRHHATAAASRAVSRSTCASSDTTTRGIGGPEGLGASRRALNASPRVRVIAQLQRAIDESPRVAAFAQAPLASRGSTVQRALIPLDADTKPGRLRDNEKTLKDLLAANGFTLLDRQKARSDSTHEEDLKARMQRVLATEEKFNGSNLNPAKRRILRDILAFEYDSLVDAAGRYRDAADAAYDAALTAAANLIRSTNPTVNELFKGRTTWRTAAPTLVPSARLAKFVSTEDYAEAVRARYKQLFKVGVAAVSTLSTPEQATLQAEKDAIKVQLAAWSTKAYNAAGCNASGTWGTSTTGAGATFAVSKVNAKVWAELKTWWQGKQNTYVTPSDTSNYSLKKHRDSDTLSPTFNYHINVG